MISLGRTFSRLVPYFSNSVARPFSINSDKLDDILNFAAKDNFSPQEHVKILQILNDTTPENLSRFKISSSRIKRIIEWQKKKGPFQSLNDVLEVEGFGEKILEDICRNIVTNNIQEVKPVGKRKKLNFLIPEMKFELIRSFNSSVAIHLGPAGIGWAKIDKEGNKLVEWHCQDFSSLPDKMLPSDIFDLAIRILKKTPIGDAYIFEALSSLNPHSAAKQMASHNQLMELYSMLLALINTSPRHNRSLEKVQNDIHNIEVIENRVFYIRSKVPARLFNTLVGYERVSGISKVSGLVNGNPDTLQTLPCLRLEVDSNKVQKFSSQSDANKELLAQGLMLGVTFMDLCIRKNAKCFEALQPKRRKI